MRGTWARINENSSGFLLSDWLLSGSLRLGCAERMWHFLNQVRMHYADDQIKYLALGACSCDTARKKLTEIFMRMHPTYPVTYVRVRSSSLDLRKITTRQQA